MKVKVKVKVDFSSQSVKQPQIRTNTICWVKSMGTIIIIAILMMNIYILNAVIVMERSKRLNWIKSCPSVADFQSRYAKSASMIPLWFSTRHGLFRISTSYWICCLCWSEEREERQEEKNVWWRDRENRENPFDRGSRIHLSNNTVLIESQISR